MSALCHNLADSAEDVLELFRAQPTAKDENGIECLRIPVAEFAARAAVMERAIKQCRTGKVNE